MPQANDAEIVRVSVRTTGSSVAERTPNIGGVAPQFQVIVESEAGNVLGGGGASYQVSIEAFDLTAGNNPGGSFSATDPLVAGGRIFNGPAAGSNWPGFANTTVFPISLTAAEVAARTNHILRYTASLVSPDPRVIGIPVVVSFAESELIMLIK